MTSAPGTVGRRAGTGQLAVAELVERAQAGQARAVARLISLVEDGSPALREVAERLAPHTGHAEIIGITGSPGVGKSTSTSAIVSALRGRTSGSACSPSTPRRRSPGEPCSVIGSGCRSTQPTTQVYIRSMASRGHLGGLAWATPQALRVLDAAGCDVVLIETVGVGQSEVEVAGLADTTVVLLAPGMGDGIQAAKAGILEVGDVFAVNKADRDGADQVVRDLRSVLSLADKSDRWRPPIVKTVAQTGEGVDDLIEAIASHRERLTSTGELETSPTCVARATRSRRSR